MGYFYFPYWMVNIFEGAYIAIYFDKLTSYNVLRITKIKIILFIISVLLLLFVNDIHFLRAIVPICILVLFSVLSFIPQKLTMTLAPYTMLIYCLHIPISRITSKIPGLLHVNHPILSLILATLFTVVVIVGIGILLKRVPLLWRVVTGGR